MTDWYDERRSKACLILGVLLEDASELECADVLYRKAGTLNPRAAAPHIRLGFLRWRAEEDAVGMYEAFSTALALGSQAVREALPEELEETQLINLVLYPKQYSLPATPSGPGAPKEVEEWTERLDQAEAELTAGRDEEAIGALEALLRANHEDPYPIPLLTLAYMLLTEAGRAEGIAAGRESMLRKVQPRLARFLFSP